MTDIFNNKILCGKCNMRMLPFKLNKNGFILRAIACPKCNTKSIHPKDEQEYINFVNLRKKHFNVKMRFVGNSYAVSIPKEIVNFMREQERIMDNMVQICFEEFGRITLDFCNNKNPAQQNKNNSISKIKQKIETLD